MEAFDISLESQRVKVTSSTLSQQEVLELIKKSGKAVSVAE